MQKNIYKIWRPWYEFVKLFSLYTRSQYTRDVVYLLTDWEIWGFYLEEKICVKPGMLNVT